MRFQVYKKAYGDIFVDVSKRTGFLRCRSKKGGIVYRVCILACFLRRRKLIEDDRYRLVTRIILPAPELGNRHKDNILLRISIVFIIRRSKMEGCGQISIRVLYTYESESLIRNNKFFHFFFLLYSRRLKYFIVASCINCYYTFAIFEYLK